mgnify:CR=1 FL=1
MQADLKFIVWRRWQKPILELVSVYIAKHPDSYLREIAEEFKVTITAVFYACKRLKITLKKRHRFTRNKMKTQERNSEKN